MVNRVGRTSSDRGRRTGFVYKPRTADVVKDRAERKGGAYDSIFKSNFDAYRAKEGDNQVRILPPTWDSADNHYALPIFIHRNIGPDNATYLCLSKMLNKHCPACAAAQEARKDGDDEDAKAIGYKEGFVCWVVDRDDKADPPIPKLWLMSWTQDREIAGQCVNARSGKVILLDHPDEGYDLVIKRVGAGLKTRYTFVVDRDSSTICDDEADQDKILEYIQDNPIEDTLQFFDADYIDNLLSGKAPAKDADLDPKEERDERPSRSERAERRPAREPAGEKSDDHDHEEAEQREYFRRERGAKEAEPERPARGRSREPDPPADEEVEEETPFEPSPPARERGRSRDRDPEPERQERSARPSRAREPDPDPAEEEETPARGRGRDTRPTRRERR